MKDKNTKGLFKGLLLALPISLLCFEWFYIRYGSMKFLFSTDPEYAYLFNGIALANLHLPLNAVGHPGTPVQVIITLVAWVVHAFRPGQTLWEDVMLHPELYINASLYSMAVMNAIMLFVMGRYVYRFSGSFAVASILQFMPFTFLMTLEVNYRLMPEAIMISLLSLWIIFLVKMIYEPEETRNYKRYSVIFALLFGLSLADKLTFLPYFVLPLFILPTWRLRLRYSILSFVFFLLFAFPVVANHAKFVNWVTNVFTHKGVYGLGEKGIVDWTVFSDNMQMMIQQTYPLLIPLLILVVILFVYISKKRKKDDLVAFSLGFISLLAISYLITAKHYAFYYMTPVLLLPVFIFFLAMLMAGKVFPLLVKTGLNLILPALFTVFLVMNTVPRSVKQLKDLNQLTLTKKEVYQQISPLMKTPPKIISAYYYGCSAIEYGMQFGLNESGKYGRYLTTIYNELYPETYIYLPWLQTFYKGVYPVSPQDFLKPDTIYTFYLADYSDDRLKEIMKALQDGNEEYTLEFSKIFHSQTSPEAVFYLKVLDKQNSLSE